MRGEGVSLFTISCSWSFQWMVKNSQILLNWSNETNEADTVLEACNQHS